MDLYYFEYSPPCRAVMLTAKTLDIQLNKKYINLLQKEHLTPEFLAINPQHSVPVLVDDDLKLWESRAICTYLVSKYGKDDSLYPECSKERAFIDRLLYFDMGILYKRFREYFVYKEVPDKTVLEALHEALKWLNDYYLNGHDFCVGNSLTVADFCLVSTVGSIIDVGIETSKYTNITAWVDRCELSMPGYDTENAENVTAYGVLLKAKFKS